MNKDALFLYGDYRTFDWCHPWYVNKLPKDMDIYISTYDTSYEQKTGEFRLDESGKWNWVQISKPPKPPHELFPAYSEYSITHTTQGINRKIFEDIFGSNLKDVHIEQRGFDEWTMFNQSPKMIGTTHFIIKHLQKIVNNISYGGLDYKNIYILRLDCLPIDSKGKIFKFNLECKENVLYSQSMDDMDEWLFAHDLVFSGRANTVINWIKHLDAEKHYQPHKGLADATREMVEKGLLKHKQLLSYQAEIIRRAMVPYMSHCWEQNIYPITETFNGFINQCRETHYSISY